MTCLTEQGDFIVSTRCDEKNNNQKWAIGYHAGTSSYRIFSLRVKGKVADRDSSKDTELQIWKSHDRNNQRITMHKIETNVYSIIIEDDCLHVKNNNKADNAPLDFTKCRDDRSHRWRISY